MEENANYFLYIDDKHFKFLINSFCLHQKNSNTLKSDFKFRIFCLKFNEIEKNIFLYSLTLIQRESIIF